LLIMRSTPRAVRNVPADEEPNVCNASRQVNN
jgi:hypothetical protein